MKKLLVILGSTATGKTDLALSLAKKYNGELISCDSRQVYKGLDIGTGKLPGKEVKVKKDDGFWEMDGVKVWMYDVADPKGQYTVYDYEKLSRKIIDDIIKRGKLPIIVGGTGLYLKALLEGLPNLRIPVDEKLRGELEKLSLEEVQKRLKSLSPAAFDKLTESDKKNPRRLLRSIELISMYGYVQTHQKSKVKSQKYDTLKIGLTAPRQVLNDKINLRVLSRLNQGMVEEARELNKNGLSFERMKSLGLEYGELAKFLGREISREEFIKTLQTKIHQYAKRQMIWFKKVKNIFWFDITSTNYQQEVEKNVYFWYHAGDDTQN